MSHLTFLEHLKSFDKDDFNSVDQRIEKIDKQIQELTVRLGSSFDFIITKEEMDEIVSQDRSNPSDQLPEDLWNDAYRQI